jgi:hypothetical protein
VGGGLGEGAAASFQVGGAFSPGSYIEPGWQQSVGVEHAGEAVLGGTLATTFPLDKNGKVDPTGWEISFTGGPAVGAEAHMDYIHQWTWGSSWGYTPPAPSAQQPHYLQAGVSTSVYLPGGNRRTTNRPHSRRFNLRAVQVCDKPAVQLDTSIQLVSEQVSGMILPRPQPPE